MNKKELIKRWMTPGTKVWEIWWDGKENDVTRFKENMRLLLSQVIDDAINNKKERNKK